MPWNLQGAHTGLGYLQRTRDCESYHGADYGGQDNLYKLEESASIAFYLTVQEPSTSDLLAEMLFTQDWRRRQGSLAASSTVKRRALQFLIRYTRSPSHPRTMTTISRQTCTSAMTQNWRYRELRITLRVASCKQLRGQEN